MYLGAIEAGGTKFVCAIGDREGNIYERIQFPTTMPEETMQRVIDFFNNYSLEAIGIGTFGPVVQRACHAPIYVKICRNRGS
ncbi:hypothetical protein CA592_09435 [Anoxybacillus flavithermus]|nr:hypothetical protein CA592_09435 [Anoxybacillus flavithermus]